MATIERLLHLLDLLQSRPTWTGPELAARLGVTVRSVRRDVDRLRGLGYPVNATQGPAGGYQLGAGRGLPPLLLSDDEAVAVAVSLRLAATGALTGAAGPGGAEATGGADGTGGVDGTGEAALRTLAKLDQVMPPRLRHEVRAIRDATAVLGRAGAQVDSEVLLTLARACRDRVRARFDYTTRHDATAARTVEPLQMVSTGRRWYLVAFDVDRADWRTFRLDRMERVRATTWGFQPREHPDPVELVQRGTTRDAWAHRAVVRYHCSAEVLRRQVPETVGRIEPDGEDRCLLHVGADDLGWMVAHLGAIGHDFDVLEPEALVAEVRRTAERLVRAVGG